MKFSYRLNKSVPIAAPVLLALLLAIMLPGAALATPPPLVNDDPPATNDEVQQTPPPTVTAPPVVTTPPIVTTPPVVTTPPIVTTPPQQTTLAPHPSAPRTPPSDCIVAHAATPAQLCSVAGGLQYYFIGADGSSLAGPYIQSFSELPTLHTAGAVSLYTGTNPFTSKSVHIDYLPYRFQDSDQHLLPRYHVRYRQALYLHRR